jgi:hypothetical protein
MVCLTGPTSEDFGSGGPEQVVDLTEGKSHFHSGAGWAHRSRKRLM